MCQLSPCLGFQVVPSELEPCGRDPYHQKKEDHNIYVKRGDAALVPMQRIKWDIPQASRPHKTLLILLHFANISKSATPMVPAQTLA